MKARNLLALILILCSSICAFGAVSPEQIKSDPVWGNHVENTKLNGEKLLPGRYVQAAMIDTKPGGKKTIAPTLAIIELERLNTSYDNLPLYSEVLNTYHDGQASFMTTFDTRGEVPIRRRYMLKGSELDKMAEGYAVAMPYYENSYAWMFTSIEKGSFYFLFPIDNNFFPENWYKGSWICEGEDMKFTFDDDHQFYMNDEFSGLYSVSDNRIALTFLDGRQGTIYALYHKDSDTLVMRFEDNPEKFKINAETFTRGKAKSSSGISPERIKQDERFALFIESTRQNAARLLPGRYVQARLADNTSGGESFFAPTNFILELEPLPYSHDNLPAYSALIDIYHDGLASFMMNLDTRTPGEVPVVKLLYPNKEQASEDYISLFPSYSGKNYVIIQAGRQSGNVRILYPLKGEYFPDKWYQGSWTGKKELNADDVKYTFDSDKSFYINDKFRGFYAVSDNRIVLTYEDTTRETIFAIYDRVQDSLIMRFADGEGNMRDDAGIFKKVRTITQDEINRVKKIW